ncbi:MAG: hypothetical protein ABL962_16535 [Fimbriimonadaceae bacterium]
MFDSDRINELSKQNEAVAEKRFKKMGYTAKPLDIRGPRKRPEFLIEKADTVAMLCEVKSIFSGGYIKDAGVHFSTQDPEMHLPAAVPGKPPPVLIGLEIDFSRMEDDLANAVEKYKETVSDMPALAGVPYVVVFFFDPFADNWDLFPAAMSRFPEVSAILRVVKDADIRDAAQAMDYDELEERALTQNLKGLPNNSKEFEIIENSSATVRLEREFVNLCRKR